MLFIWLWHGMIHYFLWLFYSFFISSFMVCFNFRSKIAPECSRCLAGTIISAQKISHDLNLIFFLDSALVCQSKRQGYGEKIEFCSGWSDDDDIDFSLHSSALSFLFPHPNSMALIWARNFLATHIMSFDHKICKMRGSIVVESPWKRCFLSLFV